MGNTEKTEKIVMIIFNVLCVQIGHTLTADLK